MNLKEESSLKDDTGSKDYQYFHNHVFGDGRYYAYDGISEEILTRLEGSERRRAERLVFQSINKLIMDERSIRAAGYLRLKIAAPVLARRLSTRSIFMRQNIHSAIVWALLKIRADKKCLNKLIYVLKNGSGLSGLSRTEAIDLLLEFGNEPAVIDALLQASLDKNFSVYSSAFYALGKIFKDNADVSNFLNNINFSRSPSERNSIVIRVKQYLGR
jgi:HEAT repeat protein